MCEIIIVIPAVAFDDGARGQKKYANKKGRHSITCACLLIKITYFIQMDQQMYQW